MKLKGLFIRFFTPKAKLPANFGEIVRALPGDVTKNHMAIHTAAAAFPEYRGMIMSTADASLGKMAEMTMHDNAKEMIQGTLCTCLESVFIAGMMAQKRLEGREIGPAAPQKVEFYAHGSDTVN